MENGRNVPSKSDLTVMATLYGVSQQVHEALEESAMGASRSNRNAVSSAGAPPARVRSTMRDWNGRPRRRITGRE
jgi:hypothetical protein